MNFSGESIVVNQNGEAIKKGWVYIAPGGKHIRVRKKGMDYVISLSDEAPLDGLKPCANIMYESLTQSNYDEITCVVLTGMGADGTGIKIEFNFGSDNPMMRARTIIEGDSE